MKEILIPILSLAVLFLLFYILVWAGIQYNSLISYAWRENPMMIPFLVLLFLFAAVMFSFSALVILIVMAGEVKWKH
jgi:hypothetical protein